MDTNLNSVKALLERAEQYKWSRVGYDDRHGEYLWAAPFCPQEQMPIGATLEPVVPAPEWNLGDNAQLTINHYNALVLNTKNMLILDVDFADRRWNKWAVSNLRQLISHMHDFTALEGRHSKKPGMSEGELLFHEDPPILWSKQTWKISTTEHGARVILTSSPFPLNKRANRWWFKALACFLGADPVYTQKCLEQECYRARLTPKHMNDIPVCLPTYLDLWSKSKPHPDLAAQLALHDQVAGPRNEPLSEEIEAEKILGSVGDDASNIATTKEC